MKISLDAAMRARDVSQPTAADEIAAAEPAGDSRGEVASSPGQSRRPRPRPHGRPRPGHGSAGNSPDSS
jgi:hypothetical protein